MNTFEYTIDDWKDDKEGDCLLECFIEYLITEDRMTFNSILRNTESAIEQNWNNNKNQIYDHEHYSFYYFIYNYREYQYPISIEDVPDDLLYTISAFEEMFNNDDDNEINTPENATKFRNNFNDGGTDVTEDDDWWIEQFEDVDPDRLPVYKNWIISSLTMNIEDYLSRIDNNVDYRTNEITIYRELKVREDWIDWIVKNPNTHVGIYWAHDLDGTDTYWDKGDKGNLNVNTTIILKSKIKINDVDWDTTLSLMMSSLYETEKELRLFKGTKLTLLGIVDKNDNDLEIGKPIKGLEVLA